MNEGTSFSKLTAFVVHETSHLLGTTEEEAQLFEHYAGLEISRVTFRDYESDKMQFLQSLQNSRMSISDLQWMLEHKSDSFQSCLSISDLYRELRDPYMQMAHSLGSIGYFVFRDYLSFQHLQFQTYRLTSFCGSIGPKNDEIFKSTDSLPVTDYICKTSPDLCSYMSRISPCVDPEQKVFNIHHLDDESFLKQLREIDRVVQILIAHLLSLIHI